MQFNWTTFVLEIVNFLVLVWVLKRFFYKPVSNAIIGREQKIERQIQETEQQREAADTMMQQYENRLNDWEEEKQQLRTSLQQELNVERAHQVDLLKKTLEEEKEKNEVLQQRRLAELQRQIEEHALIQAGQFAGQLLQDLSSVALEQSIIALFLEQLSRLPQTQREHLASFYQKNKPSVTITSAFSLEKSLQSRIEQALSKLVNTSVVCEFNQDSQLIAGVRINIGQFVFRANLQDELRFFIESAYATV